MKRIESMPMERLAELLERFPTRRIAVIGDYFLDKYLDTDPALAELSVETGKTAHQVVAIRHSPGAAGTVVANLAALGAGRLHAIGIVGDDGEAYDLLAGLRRLGCDVEGLMRMPERLTPTYLKPRNKLDPSLAGEHERYDTKNRIATPDDMARQVIESLDRLLPEVDAVIVVDQIQEAESGVITSAVREALSQRASSRHDVIFFADSRARIKQFRNLITKPNQFEALDWECPPPGVEAHAEQIAAALPALRARAGAPVIITRGGRGCIISDPEATVVPGVRVDGPLDTTGAGDSMSAGTVLALTAGASLAEAALVGNLVASITIQQLATTGTARPEQLPERLALWASQQRDLTMNVQ